MPTSAPAGAHIATQRMLEIDGLTAAYGSARALHGIDLQVGSGEIVALIGSNGAGKSTTLKAISGLIGRPPGAIRFQGQDLAGLGAERIVELGIIHVPEGRRIFPRLSVEQNLAIGAYNPRAYPKRAATRDAVYDYFPRLRERRRQPGAALSGGEQQMLAFGRAMMAHPLLLLLDEPSLGLAPIMVDEIMRAVGHFHAAGVAILLVEQDAEMALSVADRGYVLEAGRIALEGSGQALLDNPNVLASYFGSDGLGEDAGVTTTPSALCRTNCEESSIMKITSRKLLTMTLAGLVCLGGGGRAFGADQAVLGVFGPMSGDAAAMGNSEKEAVELAVKEQNAAGGLFGQPVKVIYADDSGKPEEAVNVARRLISRDNVLIALGSISSPASLAASTVFQQLETPQIVVGGTAQKITTSGNKWVFRSPVPDTKLVADLVEFIHEKFPSFKNFAFLYVNDDFGRGGFDAFRAAGEKYGFKIVADERYTRGDLDFTAQFGRIKASGAQALVEWSRYTEGALIAKQFVQTGMTLPRFGSDGVATPKYLELAGSAVNGVMYTTHFSEATASDIPAAKSFIQHYRDAYGHVPDSYAAEAYDGTRLAMMAIEAAGKPDRAMIRDALAGLSYDSVRGPFNFDEKGDPKLATHVVRVENGQESNARLMPVQN